MIHSLDLENFRKHKSLSVNFTAGMNGIFGPNYTGKTTILYGILFCLGGITAVPCRTVIKSGCSTFKTGMEFTVSGTRYKIERTKSSDRLSEMQNGEFVMIANGAKVVNKHIEQLIGMSISRFCQIRYSRQKFTSALLTLGATELHNILSEVSGADFVQQVLSRLADMKKKLDWETDGKEVIDTDSIKAELDTQEQLVKAVLESGTASKKKNEEAKQAFTEAKEAYDATSKQAATYVKYQAALVTAERVHKSAEEEYKVAKQALARTSTPEEGAIQTLRDTIADCKSTIKSADKAADAVEGLQKQLDKAVKASQAADVDVERVRLAAPEASDGSLGARLQELEEEVEASGAAVREEQVKYAKAEEELETGVCTGCNRPLHENFDPVVAKQELTALGDKISAMLADMQPRKTELSTLTRQYDEANRLSAEWVSSLNQATALSKSALKRVAECNTELEEAVTAAAEWKAKGDDAGFLLSDHEKVLEDFLQREAAYDSAKKSYDRAKRSFDSATTDLVNAEALKCTEVGQKEVDEAYKEFEKAGALQQECQDKLTALQLQYQEINTKFNSLMKDLDKAIDDNEKISTAISRLAAVKGLQKLLQQSKDDYMREVWASLMADASQLVSSATAGDIDSIQRTEEGKFSYVEDGQEFLVSEASGAQSAIMGLAVQTALARALPPVLDVLLVDEPTADMDDEKSLAFSMLLPTRAAQVICISHARMDSSTCQNIIDLGV